MSMPIVLVLVPDKASRMRLTSAPAVCWVSSPYLAPPVKQAQRSHVCVHDV